MYQGSYYLVLNLIPFLYLTLIIVFRLRDGLKYILSMSKVGNQYMQVNKPWVLVKGNDKEKYVQSSSAFSLSGLSHPSSLPDDPPKYFAI